MKLKWIVRTKNSPWVCQASVPGYLFTIATDDEETYYATIDKQTGPTSMSFTVIKSEEYSTLKAAKLSVARFLQEIKYEIMTPEEISRDFLHKLTKLTKQTGLEIVPSSDGQGFNLVDKDGIEVMWRVKYNSSRGEYDEGWGLRSDASQLDGGQPQ